MNLDLEAHIDKDHTIKGHYPEKVTGRLSKIRCGTGTAAESYLFTPQPAPDGHAKYAKIILLFFSKHDELVETHQRWVTVAKQAFSVFSAGCHGIVQCKMKDKTTQETWQRSALAFEESLCRPGLNVLEPGDPHNTKIVAGTMNGIVGSYGILCTANARTHFTIPDATLNQVYFEDRELRDWKWAFLAFVANPGCDGRSECDCEARNDMALELFLTRYGPVVLHLR